MRTMNAVVLVVVLAVSLPGVVACGGAGQGSGPVSAPAATQDYVVKVAVEPEAVTIPRVGADDVRIVYTVTNEGAKADSYDLQFTVFGAQWVPDGVPTTVDLQPGEAKDVDVPLTFDIGGTTPGFDVSLTATSRGDSATMGRAACAVSFK